MNELILIVEDSLTQAMVLEEILLSSNYRIKIAANGNKALEWLENNRPAVIISDIIMPGMDGYSFCKKIKTNPKVQNIPVILLSSLTHTSDVIKGLASGADNFISKPCDPEILNNAILNALNPDIPDELEVETNEYSFKHQGVDYKLTANRGKMIRFLFATYETAIQKNNALLAAQNDLYFKTEQLEKLNAEKDKFFSIIAHDLRSPISAFLGITELIVEDLPNMELKDLQEIVVSMNGSAENLFRLLENLLQWAKIKRGLIPYDPEIFSLLPIVTESISMVNEWAKNKDIDISCEIPEGLEVFVDSNILQTVMRNLISNAVKFTPKGGKIWLAAKPSGNKLIEVSITDSGIGMIPAMLVNLFEINNKSNRQGTEGESSSGLGLILCKDFVEKLGGEIWVESEVGKGSVFSFTIPRTTRPEE